MGHFATIRVALAALATAVLLNSAPAAATQATRVEVIYFAPVKDVGLSGYVLKVTFEDDSESAYLIDDTPDQEISYRVHFKILPSGAASTTSGNVHTLFTARGGGQDNFLLEFRADPGQAPQIRARARLESGAYDTSSWEDISNDYVTEVELEWEGGSGSNDGSFSFAINGSGVHGSAPIANDLQVVDEVRLGAVTSQSIEGSLLLDDLESSAPSQAQFLISSSTSGGSHRRGVPVGSPSGEFVVAWESYDGLDGYGYAVHARRYDEHGDPVGGPFVVNSYTTGHQKRPAVAGLSEAEPDHFVVTWWSQYGQGGDDNGVFARAYDEGTPLSSDFLVNTYTPSYQITPAAAADSSGEVVIVWNGLDADDWGVLGRRVSYDGSPIGGEFQVNSYTTGAQFTADPRSVSRAEDGDFVVVWYSSSSHDQDGDGSGVFARRFSATGTPVGSEFQVNTYTTGNQEYPGVAMNPDGEFLVVWESDGQDGSLDGVFARLYEADGDPAGSDFQVPTDFVGWQDVPSVAVTENGDWVIVWSSYGGVFNGNKARIYSPEGTALTSEIRVDRGEFGARPRVAALDGDSFLVVFYRPACGGCGRAVYGQRFRIPLFGDGFDSGDTSAWDGSGP